MAKFNVDFGHKSGFVTITGLTEKMVDKILKMLEGALWIRGNKSGTNFQTVEQYAPLPDPVEDQALVPYWRKSDPTTVSVPRTLWHLPVDSAELQTNARPSIYIRGLCCENFTVRGYQQQAAYMKTFGFKLLRSMRDEKTGKFIELWYLPALDEASGQLRYALERVTYGRTVTIEEQIQVVTELLQAYVSYRTLEVTYARMAEK